MIYYHRGMGNKSKVAVVLALGWWAASPSAGQSVRIPLAINGEPFAGPSPCADHVVGDNERVFFTVSEEMSSP